MVWGRGIWAAPRRGVVAHLVFQDGFLQGGLGGAGQGAGQEGEGLEGGGGGCIGEGAGGEWHWRGDARWDKCPPGTEAAKPNLHSLLEAAPMLARATRPSWRARAKRMVTKLVGWWQECAAGAGVVGGRRLGILLFDFYGLIESREAAVRHARLVADHRLRHTREGPPKNCTFHPDTNRCFNPPRSPHSCAPGIDMAATHVPTLPGALGRENPIPAAADAATAAQRWRDEDRVWYSLKMKSQLLQRCTGLKMKGKRSGQRHHHPPARAARPPPPALTGGWAVRGTPSASRTG